LRTPLLVLAGLILLPSTAAGGLPASGSQAADCTYLLACSHVGSASVALLGCDASGCQVRTRFDASVTTEIPGRLTVEAYFPFGPSCQSVNPDVMGIGLCQFPCAQQGVGTFVACHGEMDTTYRIPVGQCLAVWVRTRGYADSMGDGETTLKFDVCRDTPDAGSVTFEDA
jgi:hypothetical protein